MQIVGIICEYNPFHNGHLHQIQRIRSYFGENCCIVCAMSGNFVQRGAPAIFDKSIRAKAAVLSGADLVLELPVGIALSSAEGFAAGGVQILSQCCDTLSFGTETLDAQTMFALADALLSPDFSIHLKEALSSGCSFPAARQIALERMQLKQSLTNPNDILGVEYCKAILNQNSKMSLFPIIRQGSYHAETISQAAPSATAIRKAIGDHIPWQSAVPESAAALFGTAAVHTLAAGERAILARLRTMTDAEFEALPYGSEGLWRKLRKAVKKFATLEEIAEAVKSKRYTRTRIDRMILCAFLGIDAQFLGTMDSPPLVLAFSDRGRQALRNLPEYRNAGEAITETEQRINDLYGLFCTGSVEPSGSESRRRVYYHK